MREWEYKLLSAKADRGAMNAAKKMDGKATHPGMERQVELYSEVWTGTHGNFEHGPLACARLLAGVCSSAPSPERPKSRQKRNLYVERISGVFTHRPCLR